MNREAIYQALFTLVKSAATFKTASRRLKLWGDVSPSAKPAVFLVQRGETYIQGSTATPQKVILKADIYIYTNAGKDPNAVPSTQLNSLVDAIDSVLEGDPTDGQQTLGGLVNHAWIEGDIMLDPGDLDGDGLAIIPVRILIP